MGVPHPRVRNSAGPADGSVAGEDLPLSSRRLLSEISLLYRVRDWLHFLPLPLAGWVAASDAGIVGLIGGVLGWGLGLAYTAGINQAFDDRLDRLTLGKNPVGRTFRRRQAVLLSIPAAVAMIVVIGVLSPVGWLPALTLLTLATLYSAPPRLKRIPFVNTVCNVAIGLPGLFFAGGLDALDGPLRLPVGLFALLLLVSQLIHEAKDREDDEAEGIVTIATLGGMRGALGVAAASLLMLPLLTLWLATDHALRVPLTVVATAFSVAWIAAFVARIVRNDETMLRAVRLRYRYTSLVFGALVLGAVIA